MTSEQKAALRQRMHEQRAALTQPTRQAAAAAIVTHAEALLHCSDAKSATIVSSYWSIGEELNGRELEAALVARGARLCLPVIVAKAQPLVFRHYAHGDRLTERAWGIHEPLSSADVVTPDVLLVPLLAVDPSGVRLGYGGGFYDRTLHLLRANGPVVAVGLAYDEQIVDAVPAEPWDEPLDWVLTPSGLSRCGRQA